MIDFGGHRTTVNQLAASPDPRFKQLMRPLRGNVQQESCCNARGGTRTARSTKSLQNFLSAAWDQQIKTLLKKREDICSRRDSGLFVAMADEAAVVEEGISPAQSPLVAVTFQRDVHRKQKYLEAEPKALGITQIGLSLFQITCVSVFLSKGLSRIEVDIPFFISSLLVAIAGCLAVAAQNLHVPTLRACLGMQIVACIASVFNIILSMAKAEETYSVCWHYGYDNFTLHYGETCQKIERVQSHFFAETMVIQITLLAISAALAAYCCKTVNCCGPAPKMPVITVQAPPCNSEAPK